MSKIKYLILFVSLTCLGLAACDNKDDMAIFYGTHYATGMLKNGQPLSDGGDSIKNARILFYKNNTLSLFLSSTGTFTLKGASSEYTGSWSTNQKGEISFTDYTLSNGTAETDQIGQEYINLVLNATYYQGDNNQFSLYDKKGGTYVLFKNSH